MSNYSTPLSVTDMAVKAAAYRAKLEAARKHASTVVTAKDKTEAGEPTIPVDPASAPANQGALNSKKNDGKGQDQAFNPAQTPDTVSGNAKEDANAKAASVAFRLRCARILDQIKTASAGATVTTAAQGGNAEDPKLTTTNADIPVDKDGKPVKQNALPSQENAAAGSENGTNLEKKARQVLSITPELYAKIAKTVLGTSRGQQFVFDMLEAESGAKAASSLINTAVQAETLEEEIKAAAVQQAVADAEQAVKYAAVNDALNAADTTVKQASAQRAQEVEQIKLAAVQQAIADSESFKAIEQNVKQAAVAQAIQDHVVAGQIKQANAQQALVNAYNAEQSKVANYHRDQFIKLAGAMAPEDQAAAADAYDQGVSQADAMAGSPDEATAAAGAEPSLEDYIAMLQEAVASGQVSEEEAEAVLQQVLGQLQQAGAQQ